MHIKTFIAAAVVALTAACNQQPAPAPDAPEALANDAAVITDAAATEEAAK